MRKHLSLLMMYTGRKIYWLISVIILMIATEELLFSGLRLGEGQPNFALAITSSYIMPCFILIGLVLMAVTASMEHRKKLSNNNELFFKRLEISERAAFLWEIVGNTLRCLMVIAAQTITIYLFYMIYLKSSNSAFTELQDFITFNGVSILKFFFPGSEITSWLSIILVAFSFGIAATALNIRRMKVSKVLLFIWILYLITKVIANIGFSFDIDMVLVNIVLLGTDAGFLFYLMVIAHDGKGNAETKQARGEMI